METSSNGTYTKLYDALESIRLNSRYEIQASFKDLERIISNVVSVKEAHVSAFSSSFNRQRNFPFKCHYCGRKGHKAKDCFLKNRQDECKKQKSDLKKLNRLKGYKESQLQTGTIVSSTTSIKDEQEIKKTGLFINAMVNGVQCNLLLDNGATLIILSERLHAEIVKTGKNKLAPVIHGIVNGDGTLLIVQGRGHFPLNLVLRKYVVRLW